MKTFAALWNYSRKLNIKTQLIISYIILITLPIGILAIRSYYTSKDIILELATQNVLEIVKKNNQLIDEKLSKVADQSLGLVTDCSLHNIFNNIAPNDSYSLLVKDKQVTDILNQYFAQSPDIYSVQFGTSYYIFDDKTKNIYTPESFMKSTLYSSASSQAGRLIWVPTYDFTKMFNQNVLIYSNLDYRYLFSAAMTLNFTCIGNNSIANSNQEMEPPLLVVNFKDDLFSKLYQDSVSIQGSSFLVASSDGTIISDQDRSKLGSVDPSRWLKSIIKQGRGTSFVDVNGKKMIACFDTSNVTGWISVVLIPPDVLMKDLLFNTKFYLLFLGISLALLSVSFAYLFSSRITNPIQKIIQAIKKVGIGDFDAKINDVNSYEFGPLINRFNDMNDRIKNLIEENYVVKIREKETEIMALNIQLNPHFLYNTLNIMNWMALNDEKENTSKMLISLSRMLQYTTHNHEETTPLTQDLDWLREYIYIMSNRFEGKFSFHSYIDPLLMDYKVPKLFLQPFIENSILHGFHRMESGGVINLYGWIQEETVYFSVEDNGCGFEAEQDLSKIESNHVGIRNVDKRIKLLYGIQYGIQIDSKSGNGTRVQISLPFVHYHSIG